jgi:hypothetical protein
MFRVINRFSILAIGLALSAAMAIADDAPDQIQSAEQPLTEVVFVTANAPEVAVERQDDLDQEVSTMIESEMMQNLVARLTPVAPQS